MKNNTLSALFASWAGAGSPVNTAETLLAWVLQRNRELEICIKRAKLSDSSFWFYDEAHGKIVNKDNSFFSVSGVRCGEASQPIIFQGEIGYLGIICKEINGVLHFLMQAKIEPGNVNKIQISPTIQATKSNFTQKHGGKKPAYLDYFINARQYEIIVDQIQSEQSSRFYKKRNRNIIILVDEDVEILASHRWMTLWQIKELMRHDNLVNMDTRTVLSCIPFFMADYNTATEDSLANKALYRSITQGCGQNVLPEIYQCINNYKMFEVPKQALVPLDTLEDWEITDSGIYCKKPHHFKVIYCDIAIQDREVAQWFQPLFEACGKAILGLLIKEENGVTQFLVRATPEIGCFDSIELGPTIQIEAEERTPTPANKVEELFFEQWGKRLNVVFDTLLSEEGGRFYHEQNHNVIIETGPNDLADLPPRYFWVDFKTLNMLTQVNNCLNIQLRNLLSVLEV